MRSLGCDISPVGGESELSSSAHSVPLIPGIAHLSLKRVKSTDPVRNCVLSLGFLLHSVITTARSPAQHNK